MPCMTAQILITAEVDNDEERAAFEGCVDSLSSMIDHTPYESEASYEIDRIIPRTKDTFHLIVDREQVTVLRSLINYYALCQLARANGQPIESVGEIHIPDQWPEYPANKYLQDLHELLDMGDNSEYSNGMELQPLPTINDLTS